MTRQVQCHPGKGDTVDLLFALNGVPVATCELKNPMTGQTWKNAIRQYKETRDPSAPLFQFSKRALVHFAADTDEVHMTTRLDKKKTKFLPFNRGSAPGDIRCGAGNPDHPSGYRSGYFWQDVLERARFLDIVGHYMFMEHRDEKVHGKEGARTVRRETLVFPRFHQLDAVGSLVGTARAEGAGHNYLIQHSAGSGKTNSISWCRIGWRACTTMLTTRCSIVLWSSLIGVCLTASFKMRSIRSSTRRGWCRPSTRTPASWPKHLPMGRRS